MFGFRWLLCTQGEKQNQDNSNPAKTEIHKQVKTGSGFHDTISFGMLCEQTDIPQKNEQIQQGERKPDNTGNLVASFSVIPVKLPL